MLNQSIYALVIWNLGKWNSVKWNETRAIGAIFASFWVARVCQHQLSFLVLIAIGITVPWLFICLSRLCIVLKQLTISAVLLLHTTVLCRSRIALKFGLHRSTPSSPNFAPTWSLPCLFERRRHSMANCFPNGFSDSAVVTVESLWETTIAVLNGAIIDPSPFHQKLGFQMCPQDQLRDNQSFFYVRAM